MDVYEHFIWDPHVMILEGIPDDFSDFFLLSKHERLFKKAMKQLFHSVRIAYFKPRFYQKREPCILRKAIKELFRSAKIVNYRPVIRCTPSNVCSVSTRRLSFTKWATAQRLPFTTWKRQQIVREARHFISSSFQVTWRERQRYLRGERQLTYGSFRAFRIMTKRIELERLAMLKMKQIDEERRLLVKIHLQPIKGQISATTKEPWEIYKQERRRITEKINEFDRIRCKNFSQIVKLNKQIKKLANQNLILTDNIHKLEEKRKAIDFTPEIIC
jgi:hypothetical protein